jgi:hypothetical protein
MHTSSIQPAIFPNKSHPPIKAQYQQKPQSVRNGLREGLRAAPIAQDGAAEDKEHSVESMNHYHSSQNGLNLMHTTATSLQPADSPTPKPPQLQPQQPVRSSLREEFRKALLVQGKAKRTIETYVDSITRFHQFHNGLNPLRATTNHIRAYLYHLKVERNYAARTFNQSLYGLKSFYSIFMPDVPIMESFNRVTVREGEYTIISRHEFDAMMESTENLKHQAILSVLFGTGVRVSECAGIVFSDNRAHRGVNQGQRQRQ